MKKKFALLLSLASIMSIQAGQARTLKCPTADSIAVKQVGNQYEYSAQMSDKNMMMKNLYDKKLDLSSFSFVTASSSSSDNRLFCAYADSKGETLNLAASLNKGSSCAVTFPKGHDHPEISYFECKEYAIHCPSIDNITEQQKPNGGYSYFGNTTGINIPVATNPQIARKSKDFQFDSITLMDYPDQFLCLYSEANGRYLVLEGHPAGTTKQCKVINSDLNVTVENTYIKCY